MFKQEKVKAQKLKVTRDYSFLLSDDAKLPAPAKEPTSRNTFVLNSSILLLGCVCVVFNCGSLDILLRLRMLKGDNETKLREKVNNL